MAIKKTDPLSKFKTGLKTEFDKISATGVDKNTALQQIRDRITKEGGTGALAGIATKVKENMTTKQPVSLITNSDVNPSGEQFTGGIPGITTDTRKTTTDTTLGNGAGVGTGVTTDTTLGTGETPTATTNIPTTETLEEKTLREKIAAQVASKKTREQQLKDEQAAQGRGELVDLQKGFREEASAVTTDLANITKGLQAEGGAITSIAASRIREARSAPLRETLASLVEGQQLTAASLKEVDTSIAAILEARALDRKDQANTLAAQIEASSLPDAEKNRLTAQLGIKTKEAEQRDELEAFRKKEEIKIEVAKADEESLAKTGLTAEQNLQAGTIIKDFEVKEDSIAGQSIRKLLKEGKTPDQIRKILGLAEDSTGKIDDEQFTRQEKLRKEFESSATVKNYLESTQQFAGVISNLGSATGAGDMAAIFQFMKTLDPSSVVREAEFEAAANTSGIVDRAVSLQLLKKVENGELLTPKQREQFAAVAKELFNNRKQAFDERATKFINLAKEAGANPKSVVLDFDNIPGIASDLTDEDFADISGASSDEDLLNFINAGPKSGQFNSTNIKDASNEDIGNFLGFNQADQTAGNKGKITGILGPLAKTATVVQKGGDNNVLGLSGGSLTFRTNNPLAITATGAGSAERLTNKYGAIPNLFSPDSADNLVLNFNTPEEGLRAGRQLLESKGNLTIDKLLESHTGTSATGHKAQAIKLGLDLNKTYNELTEAEKNKVIEAIKIGEGFRAGTIIT